MNILRSFLLFPTLAFSVVCTAQFKNSKTVTVRIDGDCGMCEETIERVGTVKGDSEVDWDVDSHVARVTYDSTRTDLDAILQRVAHAGYDNERFLAPKEAYNELPGCCQYERTLMPSKATIVLDHGDAEAQNVNNDMPEVATFHESGMEQDTLHEPSVAVFDAYFELKNALVASNATEAKMKASEFNATMHAVTPKALPSDQQAPWIEVMESIMPTLLSFAGTSDLAEQRKLFAKLTAPMLQLAETGASGRAIYLDHCPMYEGGSDWLSEEKDIKNPFYGSMMLSCGSVKRSVTE